MDKLIGMPAWIKAVRDDDKVGVGSCSVIDECLTDAELEAALKRDGIRGKIESVRWARRVERMYRELEREVRSEIF
jgi:hypothetical protein